MRTYIHAYIHIHTYIHTYIHACMHTYIHTYIIHSYMNAPIRTYIHRDMHTYITTLDHMAVLTKSLEQHKVTAVAMHPEMGFRWGISNANCACYAKGLWRNGSASDSRSEGWAFESLWPHLATPYETRL